MPRNPEAAELAKVLATPALLADEAAQRFVGHRVRMPFEDTAGEIKLFLGAVRGHARDAMGHFQFEFLFYCCWTTAIRTTSARSP